MLVVDAMNVIGSRPTGWWKDREGAVRSFAERMGTYAASTGTRIVVVVDGRPVEGLPEGRHDRIEVLYAHASGPNAADDRIVALLEERDARVVLVTADRELRARAARRGARAMSPQQLLSDLDELDDRR